MENNLTKESKLLWSGLKILNDRNLKIVHRTTIHKTSKTKIIVLEIGPGRGLNYSDRGGPRLSLTMFTLNGFI